ncbi:hypothetical protein BJ165DRAFT_1532959 [Panaeolus papilionaceus]|nr:hypothetical protein BJ165DRAFT_1532959 [Panaeolus papilionaceus]
MEVTSGRPRRPYSPSPRFSSLTEPGIPVLQNTTTRSGDAENYDMDRDHAGPSIIRTTRTSARICIVQVGGTDSTGAIDTHTGDIGVDMSVGLGTGAEPEPDHTEMRQSHHHDCQHSRILAGPYAGVDSDDSDLLARMGHSRRELMLDHLNSAQDVPLPGPVIGLNSNSEAACDESEGEDDPVIARYRRREILRACYDTEPGSDLNLNYDCWCGCLEHNMTSSGVRPVHDHDQPRPYLPLEPSSPPHPDPSLHASTSTTTPRISRAQNTRWMSLPTPKIATATLLSLPTEIMLSILEHLPDDSLFSFSFTSRKFHALALSLYLARYGVGPLPAHQLILFDEVHAEGVVRGLRAALFSPVLNSVYYDVGCAKPVEVVRGEIETLCELVRKAGFVGEVVVNVDRVGVGDAGENDDVPDFTRALDCALARGCQSLAVYHSGAYSPDVEAIEGILKRSFSGIRGLVKTYNPSLWVPSSFFFNSTHNSPHQPTSSALTHFGLHSPILFHPTLCAWTIDTLNTSSSLTTLTITHQLSTPPTAWSALLPYLSLPKLSSLSIDLTALTSEDLFSFLKRHNTILNLDIGKSMSPPNPFTPFPKNTLKRLTHLSASPRWVTHVLQTPGAVPQLKRATVVVRESGKQRVCAGVMGVHVGLRPVMERVRALEEVGVVLSFGSVSTDWIPRYPYGTQGRDLGMVGSAVGLGNSNAMDGAATAAGLGLLIEDRDQTAPTSVVYTHTTHLELEIRGYTVPFGMTTQPFLRWLERFEKLRWLGLRTLGTRGGGGGGVADERDERGGGEARAAPFASALQKDIFVDSAKAACPSVQVVEFMRGGGVY